MNLAERKAHLIKQIGNINEEGMVEMLEQTLSFFMSSKDITDGLSPYQLSELNSLVQEPGEQDSISETDYKNATDKWRTKS